MKIKKLIMGFGTSVNLLFQGNGVDYTIEAETEIIEGELCQSKNAATLAAIEDLYNKYGEEIPDDVQASIDVLLQEL